jgi:hypothetical protein
MVVALMGMIGATDSVLMDKLLLVIAYVSDHFSSTEWLA